MWAIQLVTNAVVIAREVSFGSLPAISDPFGRMPFPASGWHQEGLPVTLHSVSCCGPYLRTENPQRRLRSSGVQPIVGTVISASPPAARVASMKRSAVEPLGRVEGFGVFSGR